MQADPPSPCVSVCELDSHGVCQGCLRTIDEIAGWSAFPAHHKQTILRRLANARKSDDASIQGARK